LNRKAKVKKNSAEIEMIAKKRARVEALGIRDMSEMSGSEATKRRDASAGWLGVADARRSLVET
jgi:hypothetical protein